MPTTYPVYRVALPESAAATVFVNGFVARNARGLGWLWRHVFAIRNATARADGCAQVKAGICGPREVVMVSYWHDPRHLGQFFGGEFHRTLMAYVEKHPDDLALYNETYQPTRSGKYGHEPNGLATIYPTAG